MSRVVASWLCLAILEALLVTAPSELFAQTIKQIVIRGNERIDDQTILEHLTSRAGEPLDTAKINNDIHAIYEMGFFFDALTIVDPTSNPNQVVLIFEVGERPKLIGLDWKGMHAITSADPRVLALDRVHLGFIMNPTEVKETIKGIEQLYHENGYLQAHVKFNFDSYPNNTGVGEFDVTEGPRDASR
jgi:outer membrane protein insertion porin family